MQVEPETRVTGGPSQAEVSRSGHRSRTPPTPDPDGEGVLRTLGRTMRGTPCCPGQRRDREKEEDWFNGRVRQWEIENYYYNKKS